MGSNVKEKQKPMKKLFSFFTDEANFRFVFVAALFFASLNVIRIWFYILVGIFMIWGVFLIGYKMICKGHILRIRNRWLIIMFLGCALLTSILRMSPNFYINIYYLAWMSVCFFLFYGIYSNKSRIACAKEVCRILDFINIATTSLMIAGLVLLLLYPRGFEYGGDSFAIHENRFVGVIFNANVTAFYAFMAVVSCNILWVIKRSSGKAGAKTGVFYIICSVINLLAMFLSDSNATLLLMIVYLWFICFYAIFRGYKRGFFSILFRIIALVLACIVIAAVLLGIRTLSQSGTSVLLSMSTPNTHISTGVKTQSNQVLVRPDDSTPATFEHQNTNIDSGRFKIWKQSVELFEKFPVFGVGKGNVIDYGKKYVGGLRYEDFHNGIITITVSYGAVGFLLFMILSITIAKSMLKTIFRYRRENRRDGRALMYLTAFCTAYCVYSMVEVALLVDFSYRVVIFWLLIGLAGSYVRSYEHGALLSADNIPDRSRSIHRIAAYMYRSRG